MIKAVWRFFTSVKLVIVLLIIIILASILGTLIPQQRSPQEYAVHYGSLANLFQRLQLTRLYQSFWYIALLFLFALNIIICTLTRLNPKLKKTFYPRLESETKSILSLKISERFRKNSNLSETKKEFEKQLHSRHYRRREKQDENRVYLLAQKRILGWFGSDLVHLGLLIILAGGITSGLGGFKKDLVFSSEGQILQAPQARFKLRLDKFETENYPNGSVKDWISTLTVLEEDKPLLTKAIEVNHPLSHKGLIFYQSGYGWNWENASLEIAVKKKDDPAFSQEFKLRLGEKKAFGDGGAQISVSQILPDFILNEKNEATTRSLQPHNPAAFIEGWQGEEKIFSGWIFARYPDYARLHGAKETNLSLELKSYEASQYSVIQAVRDPGANLIWVGCALLMAGFFLAFYWPTREIKAILEETQGRTEVVLGGISAKSQEAFQAEFNEIMTSLRRSK
jgi:cytochrome c biogenesis protein